MQPDCTTPGQWTYCPGCSTAMPAAELARKGICDECKARETAHESNRPEGHEQEER